jgi:hypothetical protein
VKAYAKSLIALLGAVSTWGVTAVAENGIDGTEWFLLLGAVATALGVWAVPNVEETDDEGHADLGQVVVLALAIGLGLLIGHWLVVWTD